MKRRTLVSCSLWLLPLLMLRLLVPAGYMLDASTGELRIVVCAGAAAPRLNAAQSQHAQHDHAHHHEHHAGGHHGGVGSDAPPSAWHGDVSCPFAQLGSVLPALALHAALADAPSTFITANALTMPVGVDRVHSPPIRGPPVLS